MLQTVIEEANDGHWPYRLRHWRRVGQRLDHDIDWLDPAWGVDAHASAGVVYINAWRTRPLSRRQTQLEIELRHEMIETACQWEGVPPICYPPELGNHHQLTVELENELLYGDEMRGAVVRAW